MSFKFWFHLWIYLNIKLLSERLWTVRSCDFRFENHRRPIEPKFGTQPNGGALNMMAVSDRRSDVSLTPWSTPYVWKPVKAIDDSLALRSSLESSSNLITASRCHSRTRWSTRSHINVDHSFKQCLKHPRSNGSQSRSTTVNVVNRSTKTIMIAIEVYQMVNLGVTSLVMDCGIAWSMVNRSNYGQTVKRTPRAHLWTMKSSN